MSALIANSHQIGQNATASLNIVLSTDASGNLIISKGVYGGTLTQIASIPNGGTAPQTFTATAGQTAFTLANTPLSAAATKVYSNGLRLTPTVDYTVSGTTLTLTSAASLNDELLVEF